MGIESVNHRAVARARREYQERAIFARANELNPAELELVTAPEFSYLMYQCGRLVSSARRTIDSIAHSPVSLSLRRVLASIVL